jgi:proteasome-associated ATPase
MLKEVLADGERALVISHADEERVVRLAAPLLDQVLRGGDSLLLEPRSGYVYEKIPKAEVEELILEEVPDISYHDIGGLSSQIEQIRDAIELPYLHADLFREHQPRTPSGTSFFLNIKGPELLNKYAGVLTELPLHPGDLPSVAPPCCPIPGMCSINGVYMPSGVRRDR